MIIRDSIKQRNRGFSLVELVIVIVIIGVLAAIALPRFSKAAGGANDAAVASDLAVLRNAIELFGAEHEGNFPEQDSFVAQLTGYTLVDLSATTVANAGALGPYLQSVPLVKVGGVAERVGTITATAGTTTPTADGSGGWLYNEDTGQIWCNVATYEAK